MRFLISMVFVWMLALSSQAFANKREGALAEEVLLKGQVVAEHWDSAGVHHTRLIWGETYFACFSGVIGRKDTILTVWCVNVVDN